MKTLILGLTLALLGAAVADAQTIPAYVKAAVADPGRGDDAQADARRHPAELATFAEVKPGDSVVDLIPGNGYFTRVFSKIVGPKGQVYAIWPNEYAKVDSDDVATIAALAKNPAYANVSMILEPGAAFSTPKPVDVVWTSQNYHDYPDKFMGNIDPSVLDKAVFAALKPGGLFIVVDHVAEAGSGSRDTDTLHRIDPALVRKQVEAAGFVFEGESNVLRNPADTHKLKVFDKTIRGHTDQFAYKFRKPK